MSRVRVVPILKAVGLVVLGGLAVVLASSCHAGGTSYIVVQPPRPAPLATDAVMHGVGADTLVDARFHNVRFHVWPGVALDLADLYGVMHSTRPDRVVSFDDKTSFVVAIDTGVVALPLDDLARLMNTYVLAYKGAPLRELSFASDGPRLVQRGILHKVVDIPFEMVADVSATPSGEIRVRPVSMKICTIPGKGLMEALGVTLAKLLDLGQAKGMRVDGNDLFLDPVKIIPPPAITGHLASVRVEPGRMVQVFAPTRDHVTLLAPGREQETAGNYMYFRNGTLQFGKLFMVHADMQVIDLAPEDAFDFDIGFYHEQLVAGHHRTTPSDGLLVYMPDLSKMTPSAIAGAGRTERRASSPPSR